MIKKRGRPPKNPNAAASAAPKRAYTKRAKADPVSTNEETVDNQSASDSTEEKVGYKAVDIAVDDSVVPSDNLEDAIAEIWDAFVLRNVLNPKVFGKREMDIFRRYKDVANSIIAEKKAEAEKQKVVEDTESEDAA